MDGASRFANVAGALLCGGASSRMGRDKAALPLYGRSLAARGAGLLHTLFEEVLLVGGEPPADVPGQRLPDGPGPRCALRGLVAALEAARAERVVVLATDLPRVTPDLLLALVSAPEADAVVPRTAAGPEPLCALYRREPVALAARERLARGDLALRGLLGDVPVSWLEGDTLEALDPDGDLFANVNTPEDWRALSERAGSRAGP